MLHIWVFMWIWPILADLGMQSIIFKQQVVRCASLLVPMYQHQSAPNMTIAGETDTYHQGFYIRWQLNSMFKAHQSLSSPLWHFQNYCCHLCLLAALVQFRPIPSSPHAQAVHTCMATLGWWWSIQDHWSTQRSICLHKTICPPLLLNGCIHTCAKNLKENTNHWENIKHSTNTLTNY